MITELEDLRTRLPGLAEEELLRIATVDRDQYVEEAVALVRGELKHRGVDEVSVARYRVLKAGREHLEASSIRRPPRWLAWVVASTNDPISALRVARQGAVTAIIVAGMTGMVAVLAILKVPVIADMGFDAYAFIDAALFAGIAVGVWRGSLVFAVLGLGLFLVERAYMWATQGTTPGALALFLLLAFLNGVRGARALRAYRQPRLESGGETIEPR